MRVARAVAVSTFLTVAAVMAPSGASAQNPFGDVTNAPRSSEFIHWDADAFADLVNGLEGEIEDGSRIWGTRFVYTSVLPESPHRPHDISVVHREGYTQPEIHETKWDLYVVVDGSGTLLVGGERVGWIDDGRPPEEQRPRLEGATEFEVEEGDVVHVPARSWHQLVLEEGERMTYMLINVME